METILFVLLVVETKDHVEVRAVWKKLRYRILGAASEPPSWVSAVGQVLYASRTRLRLILPLREKILCLPQYVVSVRRLAHRLFGWQVRSLIFLKE